VVAVVLVAVAVLVAVVHAAEEAVAVDVAEHSIASKQVEYYVF
jgi:hypothetical protein